MNFVLWISDLCICLHLPNPIFPSEGQLSVPEKECLLSYCKPGITDNKDTIVWDLGHEVVINPFPMHSCQVLTSPPTLVSSQKPSGLGFFSFLVVFLFCFGFGICCLIFVSHDEKLKPAVMSLHQVPGITSCWTLSCKTLKYLFWLKGFFPEQDWIFFPPTSIIFYSTTQRVIKRMPLYTQTNSCVLLKM